MQQTAITDIIASYQISETKISAKNNDFSPLTKSNFEEMVAFFQKENSVAESEPAKFEYSNSVNEKQESEAFEEVKTEEKNQESSKNSEKIPEKAEDSDKSIRIEEKKSEKTELKQIVKVEKTEKQENVSEVKTDDKLKNVKKTEVKEKNESQKAFDQEINRFNQFISAKVEKSEPVENESEKKIITGNKKIEKSSDKSKESFDDYTFELKDRTDNSKNVAVNVSEKKDNKNSLENQKKSNKESFTIDKQGKITVEDRRTEPVEPKNVYKKSELKTEMKVTGENSAQMTMELSQNTETNVLSLNGQTAASNGSNFQAMLNNQIQMNTPDIVKAGNIVLKDNNQGSIDLIIHPDDLGNVKINLSLNGKELTGHITVATKEAMEVFKDNAQTLREAFIESGFENVNFDVSMGNNGNFNQSGDFGNGQEDNRFIANRTYSNDVEISSAGTENNLENSSNFSDYSVNIVA